MGGCTRGNLGADFFVFYPLLGGEWLHVYFDFLRWVLISSEAEEMMTPLMAGLVDSHPQRRANSRETIMDIHNKCYYYLERGHHVNTDNTGTCYS